MAPLRRLLTHRLRPIDLFGLDVLAAAMTAALCAYAATESPSHGGYSEPTWLSLLAGALLGLPILARRAAPVTVAVAVTLASAVVLLTGVVPGYAAAAPALAVALTCYTVGLLAPGHGWILIGSVALMTLSLVVVPDSLWGRLGAATVAAVIIGPAWLAGVMLRERRAQLMREAATEERLRLARDLHDVVGHTMSLITVKASVALHVAEERPAEALDALRAIEMTSREALMETRRVLGLLRADAPLADDLRAMAGRASAGGVTVRLDVQPGVFDEMSEAVARTAYRIVQEALTNVVKHAAPANCLVGIAADPDGVRIDIVDDGSRPAREPGPGHGLIGMRERTSRHGGTFAAGVRPGGGFKVSVLLPRGASP